MNINKKLIKNMKNIKIFLGIKRKKLMQKKIKKSEKKMKNKVC